MSDTEQNAGVICDFIDDGYVESATIEAEAGVNNELTFKFRPALAEQTSPLIDASEVDATYMKLAIDLLSKLITEWTLKDRNNNVVKVDRANIARVNRKLLTKIIDRVCFRTDVGAGLKN